MKKKLIFLFILSCLLTLKGFDFKNDSFSIQNCVVTQNYSEEIFTAYYDIKTNSLFSNFDGNYKYRKLEKNLKDYPQLETGDKLIDFLYNMAIEEILLNINDKGFFVAGEKWKQAWTRDISYSVYLSLAFIFNEVCKNSLNTRVANNKILQDTGTGGSYPISTDRIVWALAAYEVYLYSMDKEYGLYIYNVIKNSMIQDLDVCYDKDFKLFKGEQSFLDWREQTYPIWAQPVDIGESFALNTNLLHLRALEILIELSKDFEMSEDIEIWKKYYNELKFGIKENLWLEKRKYYAAYILNGAYPYCYEGYETLGESLAVIFNIQDKDKSYKILNAIKPSDFGMPVVSPQLLNISPYHNDAIWPFVQAYRGWAASLCDDIESAEFEFACLVRSAALFQTFKENMVASTGDKEGTAINSDRQLWSVAGYLAFIYRVLFGINIDHNGLYFKPSVFSSLNKGIKLKNFKFNNCILDISMEGTGNIIDSIIFDDKKVANDYRIPTVMAGNHKIKIILKGVKKNENIKKYSYNSIDFAPSIPMISLEKDGKNNYLVWRQQNSYGFTILKNGKFFNTTFDNEIKVENDRMATEYSILSISNSNVPVLRSNGIWLEDDKNTFFYEIEKAKFKDGILTSETKTNIKKTNAKFTHNLNNMIFNGTGYLKEWGKKQGEFIEFKIKIKKQGRYIIDLRYQNGSGPINTGERCAIREVSINSNFI